MDQLAKQGFLQKHHRILFYGCWILLGLIQSAYTELLDDEAYYWTFSRFLDWGYYDHPPMIALLVKIGYAIFPNELGVRLLPFALNVFSLVLIENLIERKNPYLFYSIALSIAAIQLMGFVAVPDIPLIFFTALFFWCYKLFTSKTSLLHSLYLGLSIALLCYSKYHGVLIVLFTLMSNPKLFIKYQAWLAAGIAAILFAPHLWWQYQHDWVSVQYHLFESNVNPYKISHTTDFLIGQLLLPGPLAGFILLPAAFLYKQKSTVERALKFTLVGIYLFFLLSSFRGKVEGNWTSPTMVPLIVLAHQFLLDHNGWRKWLIRLLPATMVLVLFGRILMIVDIVPIKAVRERFHSWANWPAVMKEKTHGLPVVFSNSYQRASKYWFYTKQETFSLNHYKGRKTNFDFWPLEENMLGKPVYYMDIYGLERFPDTLKTPIGTIGYKYDPNFESFGNINFETFPKQLQTTSNQPLTIDYWCTMRYRYGMMISESNITDDTVRVAFFTPRGEMASESILPVRLKDLRPNSRKQVTVTHNLKPGKYFMRFSINCGYRNPTVNSDKIKVTVK